MHPGDYHKLAAIKRPEVLNLRSINGIPYLQFDSLSGEDHLVHGIFTRHGGVSDPPYDSLNTAYDVGDRTERVKKNLRKISEVTGAERLIFMDQVHGGKILVLRKADHPDLESTPCADAVIIDIPWLAIMVKLADCQGVILYDQVKLVLGLVHCGWRGNINNILGSVIGRMKSEFGCMESDILAAIGPSLGPCCAEFKSYHSIFPPGFITFMVSENYINLWEVSRSQLLDAGLNENNIDIAEVCTKCNTQLFYSYRAQRITGRFATVAMLQ
jgi:YfiH family protein